MTENKTNGNRNNDGDGVAKKKKNVNDIFKRDKDHIDALYDNKPWKENVSFFKNCKISGVAGIKMLKHALVGVKKGAKQNTKPIEVMGLLVGKPDGNSFVIFDAIPLPVEGTETRVIADDVGPYMSKALSALEIKGKGGFIGWYHSHPFDVESYSHCHLSATDIGTQHMWQYQLGAWCAIVIDPLRSIAKGRPELGCFYNYPPNHSPPQYQCPDGTIGEDEDKIIERWGLSYFRYYSLKQTWFVSKLGKKILDTMSKDSLWVNVLSTAPVFEEEKKVDITNKIKGLSKRLGKNNSNGSKKATSESSEIAIEQCQAQMVQISKALVFNNEDESDEKKG